jgi:serine/threonine protein kinase
MENYVLKKTIGSGSFGVAYHCQGTNTKKDFVLKAIQNQSEDDTVQEIKMLK